MIQHWTLALGLPKHDLGRPLPGPLFRDNSIPDLGPEAPLDEHHHIPLEQGVSMQNSVNGKIKKENET